LNIYKYSNTEREQKMTNIRIIDKNQKLLPNKIGTQFGSVNNWIASKTWYGYDQLAIGNGATAYFWSDRHACTVVEIINRNKKRYVVVQQDHAKRTDRNGFSESQTYEFTPNLKGRKFISEVIDIETEDGQRGFILEPRSFNPKTNRFRKEGTHLGLGQRSEYWDPSF